jgi:hypothetical protein
MPSTLKTLNFNSLFAGAAAMAALGFEEEEEEEEAVEQGKKPRKLLVMNEISVDEVGAVAYSLFSTRNSVFWHPFFLQQSIHWLMDDVDEVFRETVEFPRLFNRFPCCCCSDISSIHNHVYIYLCKIIHSYIRTCVGLFLEAFSP